MVSYRPPMTESFIFLISVQKHIFNIYLCSFSKVHALHDMIHGLFTYKVQVYSSCTLEHFKSIQVPLTKTSQSQHELL